MTTIVTPSARVVRVPDYARAHILAYPAQPIPEAAHSLGVASSSIRQWRHWLIKDGVLASMRRSADLDAALEAIEDGALAPAAARAAGSSLSALSKALQRADLTVTLARQDRVYSARELARLFGMSPTVMLRRWFPRWRAAGLRARRRKVPGAQWRVTAHDLMAWLDSPEGQPYRARVADPEWRAYLDEISAAQVAPIRNHEIRRWFGDHQHGA